ncbi:MAG: hypothetical protein IKE85_05075 [Mogibacterium sp.]|nr:hypothetical protein [Mogibacterium sp.]MBR2540185.1 hypothetical protein [Mogibacterium sp.]
MAAMLSEDDLTSDLGIRVVFKLADEVTYHNLLGLNVLTILLTEKKDRPAA